MQNFSASPRELVASAWRHRQLIAALTRREVAGRYRGSWLGLAWSFLTPLLMLLIYTLVFAGVFHARWDPSGPPDAMGFALALFVGLIVHGLLAECVNRAPDLVVGQVNYVKKVVFPLEVLPWVVFLSALFQAGVGLVVWLLFHAVVQGFVSPTAVLVPLVLLPLMLATLGLVWFLSALGVYLRDIGHVTSMFTTALLFLSGVFYPLSALPEPYQAWARLNPLALSIEQARQVLIAGQWPSVTAWLTLLGGGLLLAWLGFAWFQRTRKGFADVL